MKNKFKVAINLPYLFSVRDFFFTPVWEKMKECKEAEFILICPNEKTVKLAPENHANIKVISNYKNKLENPKRINLSNSIFRRIEWKYVQKFYNDYLYDSLTYRHCRLQKFSNSIVRQRKSPEEQERLKIFYEYRKAEAAGKPFPDSKWFFKLLYKIYCKGANRVLEDKVSFIKELNPDIYIFGRLQFQQTAYWANILKKANIPMAGIISSWDHLTTKGPIPRGMSAYFVASQRMKEEIQGIHGIHADKVIQTGKVQMDIFKDESVLMKREEFLKRLNIPTGNKLITFGTNTTGLKEHEVSIAGHLARKIADKDFGNATLFFRTHPQDTDWKRDFMSLTNAPAVMCQNSCSFGLHNSGKSGKEDQIFLANLMKHSDIVIQSRGSLALDAIAFDTPVLNLGFDGDLERKPNDSFFHEYDFEHYKPIIMAGGTSFIGSYDALYSEIEKYLENPDRNSAGRERTRQEQLEPFDGEASSRLVSSMVKLAQQARSGTLPEGDWNYKCIHNLDWYKEQLCDLEKYLIK